MLDLKEARKRAYLTQADLAEILGISQAQVSRYEADPDTIPMRLMLDWLPAVGMDLADLQATTGISRPSKGVEPGTPYREMREHLARLERHVDAAGSGIDEIEGILGPEDLKQRLQVIGRKPTVATAGSFDAGKSHLANTLLGGKFLPANYQPATSVITFVRHVDDRPDWFKEDVWIMSDGLWDIDTRGRPLLDVTRLQDRERCVANRLVAGSLETLKQYGVRGGRETERPAHTAIVYLDAPLLSACDLVDFPGQGVGEGPEGQDPDAYKADSAFRVADVVLYASTANGHMNGQDFVLLAHLLRHLPPPEAVDPEFPTLGNLYVVATHASNAFSDDQVRELQDAAARRLFERLDDSVFRMRGELTKRPVSRQDLRSRFFAFWSEMPKRRDPLEADLARLLGSHLPRVRAKHAADVLRDVREPAIQHLTRRLKAHEAVVDAPGGADRLIHALEENEGERSADTTEQRRKIVELARRLEEESISEFRESARGILNPRTVEEEVRRSFPDRKEAQEYLAGHVGNMLQDRLTKTLDEKTRTFQREVESFLDHYEAAASGAVPGVDFRIDLEFDARAAFAGGVAGAATFGGLAAWAASVGNLGGYILVAKGVGVLSALGVSVGGGAAASTMVAAIGGPITLGIGLAVAMGISTWALFGKGWESRLAKRLVEHFERHDVVRAYVDAIARYWHETRQAFHAGADEVERQFQAQLEDFRTIAEVSPDSSRERSAMVDKLHASLRLFEGLRWDAAERHGEG